jgi:hypothetical protein
MGTVHILSASLYSTACGCDKGAAWSRLEAIFDYSMILVNVSYVCYASVLQEYPNCSPRVTHIATFSHKPMS